MFTLDDLNDPAQILDYLAEAIRAVYEGLDHGISLAEAKMTDLPQEPWLRSHLVRVGTLVHLSSLEPTEWKVGRELPLSGIEVVRDPLTFRVLRSQGGGPPHPGKSLARRIFWSNLQQHFAFDTDGVQVPQQSGANFILDWTVGAGQQIVLALSKPKGIWKYQGEPKLEWRRGVVISETEGLSFEPADEDIEVEPKFDLTELEGDGEVE